MAEQEKNAPGAPDPVTVPTDAEQEAYFETLGPIMHQALQDAARGVKLTRATEIGFHFVDEQGQPWSTIECINHQQTCSVCGQQFTRGYARGMYGEQVYFCGCTVDVVDYRTPSERRKEEEAANPALAQARALDALQARILAAIQANKSGAWAHARRAEAPNSDWFIYRNAQRAEAERWQAFYIEWDNGQGDKSGPSLYAPALDALLAALPALQQTTEWYPW